MPSLREFRDLIAQYPDASDEELLSLAGGRGNATPEAPSFLSKAWEWGNAPLVDLADDTFGDSGAGRVGTSLVESMTSPLSLAGLALSGGASLAGKAGLLGLSRGARATEAALNVPYIAEGLGTLAGAEDAGTAAGGAIEAALGGWGLKGAMGRPTQSGASLADDLLESRFARDERGSFPLRNTGEPDLPYEDIVARTRGGGSTTRLDGTVPDGTHSMVGGVVPPRNLPPGDFTPEALARFTRDHRRLLEEDPTRALGTWINDDGQIAMDVSDAVPGIERALALAGRRGEDAIFHMGTGQELPNPLSPKTAAWQELVHRSTTPGLEVLDPAYHGRGIPGTELARKSAHPGTFLNRTYWNTPRSAVEDAVAKGTQQGDIYTSWAKPGTLFNPDDPANAAVVEEILAKITPLARDDKELLNLFEQEVAQRYGGLLSSVPTQQWDPAAMRYQPTGVREDVKTFAPRPVVRRSWLEALRNPGGTAAETGRDALASPAMVAPLGLAGAAGAAEDGEDGLSPVQMALLAGAGVTGAALARRVTKPLVAYHGTPHDFDRFDLSKIGTGEGNQTYGHGLYFAQEPAVAKEYQRVLSLRPGVAPPPTKWRGKSKDEWLFREAEVQTQLDLKDRGIFAPAEIARLEADLAEARHAIAALPDADGFLYQVGLHTTPERLLDWDKPLDAQSSHVRDVLAGHKVQHQPAELDWDEIDPDLIDIPNPSGQQAYRFIGTRNGLTKPEITDRLRADGIDGITYLDRISRFGKAEKTSSNLVSFRDDIVEILRKFRGQEGQNFDPLKAASQAGADEAARASARMAPALLAAPAAMDEDGELDPIAVALATAGLGVAGAGLMRRRGGPANAPYEMVGDRLLLSTRVPTGKAAVAATEPTRALMTGVAEASQDPALLRKLALGIGSDPLLSRYRPFLGARGGASPADVVGAFASQASGSIGRLIDMVPEALRARAGGWYEGAHRLGNELGARIGVSGQQGAGLLATQSPSKDWNQNIDIANRLGRWWREFKDTDAPFTQEHFDQYANAATQSALAWIKSNKLTGDAAARVLANAEQKLADARSFIGTRFEGLPDTQRAQMIRAHSELVEPPHYSLYTPEGDAFRTATTGDGTPALLQWQSYPIMANGLSVLEDDSPAALSAAMGMGHKVRSFFNNINVPLDSRSVTVDTHNIAGAHFRPLGGSAPEVGAVMAGPGSAALGISGGHAMYRDAVAMAAAQRGLRPAQAQSISWEGIKGLFTPVQKRDRVFNAALTSVFEDYRRGTLTEAQLYDRIEALAGGFRPAEWAAYPPAPHQGGTP